MATFSEAPLSCRTAEFPRSGWKSWPFDGEPSHPPRGLSAGTHTPHHARFALLFVPFPTSAYPGSVSEHRADLGTTKHPESLCLISALPLSGRRASPPAGTLLPGHGSYGLMRRSRSALPSFGLSLVRGVSAGCYQPLLPAGPSRRYLCESFLGCLGPYHGGTWSAFTCFFLHVIGLPPYTIEVGFPAFARQNDFLTDPFFGTAAIRLSSGPQVCSPPRSFLPLRRPVAEQPRLLHPSRTYFVSSAGIGHTNHPIQAIDGVGTYTPRDSQPCRLLQRNRDLSSTDRLLTAFGGANVLKTSAASSG